MIGKVTMVDIYIKTRSLISGTQCDNNEVRQDGEHNLEQPKNTPSTKNDKKRGLFSLQEACTSNPKRTQRHEGSIPTHHTGRVHSIQGFREMFSVHKYRTLYGVSLLTISATKGEGNERKEKGTKKYVWGEVQRPSAIQGSGRNSWRRLLLFSPVKKRVKRLELGPGDCLVWLVRNNHRGPAAAAASKSTILVQPEPTRRTTEPARRRRTMVLAFSHWRL